MVATWPLVVHAFRMRRLPPRQAPTRILPPLCLSGIPTEAASSSGPAPLWRVRPWAVLRPRIKLPLAPRIWSPTTRSCALAGTHCLLRAQIPRPRMTPVPRPGWWMMGPSPIFMPPPPPLLAHSLEPDASSRAPPCTPLQRTSRCRRTVHPLLVSSRPSSCTLRRSCRPVPTAARRCRQTSPLSEASGSPWPIAASTLSSRPSRCCCDDSDYLRRAPP